MAKTRRALTDADILEMVVNSRSSRILRVDGPERRANSISHTATFLWLALAITGLALAGSIMWEVVRGPSEKDRDHCARPGSQIECPQRREGKAGSGGEGKDVRHGAMVVQDRLVKYVRGVRS